MQTKVEQAHLSYTRVNGLSMQAGRLLSPALLFTVDYLAIVCALWSAHVVRDGFIMLLIPGLLPFSIPEHYTLFILPAVFLTFTVYEKLYTKRLPLWQSIELLFKICAFSIAVIVGILFFAGEVREISRLAVFLSWLFVFLYMVIARFAVKRLLAKCGLWQKPVVLVGAGKTAELLAQAFDDDPNMGYKIVGIIEDNHAGKALLHKYPLLGGFDRLEKAIRFSGVQDVLIATPGLDRESLLRLLYRVQPLVNNVVLVPNLFGIPLGNLEVESLFQQKALLLRIKNNLARGYNRIVKYTLDMVFTCVGGIALLPILALISLLIYLDSPGPIIFAHRRIGVRGSSFPCYKFRTMVPDATAKLESHLQSNPEARAEWERDFKLRDDPRITRMGKWLRRTSLDELPQLLNVLRGEMSLVGPRPIVAEEIVRYKEYINDYYLVRPGITGFWQVNGRNDVDYDTRVEMDSWYVRNWSVWLDIVLLVRTVGVVLDRKGAY